MRNILIAVAALIVLAFLGYEGCNRVQRTSKEFEAKQDSLVRVVDSLVE